MNQVKVVLLGQEYGGKTSLVERFINQRFIDLPSDMYQATIGAAFALRKITVDKKGNTVSLAIWDTAGSERFAPMGKMYSRNARAAIVCFDLTDLESFEKAKYWIREVKSQEEDCAIYLCGTKCDMLIESNLKHVGKSLIKSLQSEVGAKYYETSSKTGQGVTRMFVDIAHDFRFHEMETEEKNGQKLKKDDKVKEYRCYPCI